MKKQFLFILFVLLLVKLPLTPLCAVNAYPLPITVKQPNGASLSILMRGDELFHYQTTTDGYLLETNAEGYLTYAKIDDTGKIISSGMIASDIEKRTPKETLFLKDCRKADNLKALRAEEKRVVQQASRSIAMSEQIQGGVLSPFGNSSPRVLVILVNFSDVQFVTPSPNTAFSNQLNQEGYSANGATGSAREYFMASSFGQFSPTFDVIGPVTLPNPMSYYGQSANSSVKYDANPRQMVTDACIIAQKEGLDLRIYDTNRDRYVDNVFVIFAGYSQSEGGSKDAIWPHMGIAKETSMDYDMQLKRYACCSELKGNTGSEMCGIGTFCHEFSHVIGLPDLYHTVADKSTLGYWSIMSNGSYNNGSRTPPTYSCYERFYLGYFKPDQARTPNEITLYPLSQEKTPSTNTSNQSFILSKGKHNQDPIYPSPNEFFMVEYRKRTGWDRYLPGEGMLIWHIDYNREAWVGNTLNNFSGEKQTAESHMRVYLQPLNGSTETPGAAFTSGTFIPTAWEGYELNQNISSITKTNESVTFKFTSNPVICNIETPGTLSTVIPRTSIFSLALTGVIDARDIKYLRNELPYLGYLDLSGVTIESYTEPSGSGYYPANELPERSFYRSGTSSRDTILKNVILPTSITSIGKHAFEGCIFLDSIRIPDKTTSIGDSAFFNCKRLSYVTIPASTTFIGRGAFSGCPWNNNHPAGLIYMGKVAYKYVGEMPPGTSITLAEGTTGISDSAFTNCKNLISITLPKGVTSIGRSAFDGCTGLTSLTIPSGITSIWERAFNSCTGLTLLTIPESVTTIDAYAFCDCKELTSLTIPGKVISIGEGAFSGCQKLTSAVCPSSLKTIESRAFYNCFALTTLIPPSNVDYIGRGAFANTAWYNTLADGLVIIGKVVYKYKGVMPANTSITLPEDTKCITDSAFYKCSGLISITIPECVTKIGELAFSNCRNLTSLTLPPQITTLSKGIFQYCSNLKSLIIPENVTTIGPSAFYNCLSLPSITIPKKVTAIKSFAFGRCPRLFEIYSNCIIPPELEEDCFDDANKDICSVYVPASSFFTYLARKGWKELLLMGHYDIKMTTAGELLDLIGLTNLQHVSVLTLSGPVNGKDMLMVQTQFPHLKILDMTNATIVSGGYVYTTTDNQIGDYMFYNLKNLETVTLPTTVTSIGNYAFSGCNSLESMTIPSYVTTIGSFAFYNCTSMRYISFPNTIKSFGNYAFSGCSSLTSLTIPPEVTTISYYAFYNCSGLTSVMIPSKVTSIRTHAFAFCNNMKAIYTLNPNPPTVYVDGFEGIDKSECILHIPPGSYPKYYPADGWSEFLNFSEKNMTDEKVSELAPVSLFVQDNLLVIRGADPGAIITIYTVSGVKLLSLPADGEEQRISLPSGALYFVKVGSQTLKVVL